MTKENNIIALSTFSALESNNLPLLEKLLKNHGLINVPRPSDGKTLLHLAVETNNLVAVYLLLNHKANPNIQEPERGYTPLHCAQNQQNAYEITVLLVKGGADIEIKSKNKFTALYLASCYAESDTFYYLSSFKKSIVDDDITNEKLLTALVTNQRDLNTLIHILNVNDNKPTIRKFPEILVRLIDNPNPKICEVFENLIDNHVLPIEEIDKRYVLHKAIKNNRFDVFKVFINNGANVNYRSGDNESPIFEAVRIWENAEYTKVLIENGANVNLHAKLYNNTPLFEAVRYGNLETVKLLIAAGANLDHLLFIGRNLLHEAAINEHDSEVFKYLCHMGFSISFADDDLSTPFHKACENTEKGKEIVSFILKSKIDINIKDRFNRTPLHYAANAANYEVISVLIKNGANVSMIEDEFGYSALHMATSSISKDEKAIIKTIKLLLKSGADLKLLAKDKSTPLVTALNNAKQPVIKYLFKIQSDHISSQWIMNTLTSIVKNNFHSLEALKLLEKEYPNIFEHINVLDEEGLALLHHAAQKTFSTDLVKFLISKGADPNIKDAKGYTPVYYTILKDNDVCLSWLLSLGGKLETTDKTSLYHLAAKGSFNPIFLFERINKHLPNEIFKINMKDESGDTALHIALKKSCYYRNIKFLLDNGAEISIRNNNFESPLHLACRRSDADIVNLLIERGSDINALDKNGNTPLHNVRYNYLCRYNVFETLINLDPKIIANKSGETLFTLLSKSNDKEDELINAMLKEHLLKQFNDPYLQKLFYKGTLKYNASRELHFAIIRQDLPSVKHLLSESNEVVDYKLGRLESSLISAIRAGNIEIVQILLRNGANINSSYALHMAVRMQNEQIIKILIKQGADINLHDCNNYAPIHYALRDNNHNIIDILKEYGSTQITYSLNYVTDAETKIKNNEECKELTELRIFTDKQAVSEMFNPPLISYSELMDAINSKDDVELVRDLLKKGADINPNYRVCPRYIDVFMSDNKENIEETYKEVQFIKRKMVTPLEKAFECSANKVAKVLLEYGARHTLLSYIWVGEVSKAKELLNNGVDIDEKWEHDQTLLHYAVRDNQVTVVKTLIELGADVNARDFFGETPLFLAVANDSFEIVKLLIKSGAELNIVNNYNKTLINEALNNFYVFAFKKSCSMLDMINYLLQNGFKPNLIDAIELANNSLVRKLLEDGIDPNSNLFKENALHYAARNGNIEAVNELIYYGCNINPISLSQKTPLDLALEFGHTEIVEYLKAFGARVYKDTIIQ